MVGTATRRAFLEWLATSAGVAAVTACTAGSAPAAWRPPWLEPPTDSTVSDVPFAVRANVRAVIDVFLPSERSESGRVLSPGGLDVGAYELLGARSFYPAALALGLVPDLPADIKATLDLADAPLHGIVSAELDRRARRAGEADHFAELSREKQEELLHDALTDDASRALFQVVRAATFVAYLGAVRSDVGLVAIGYPAFEDFERGVAISGYPKRLADGSMDDYTYNRAPIPTAGVNLADYVDERGDLRG